MVPRRPPTELAAVLAALPLKPRCREVVLDAQGREAPRPKLDVTDLLRRTKNPPDRPS